MFGCRVGVKRFKGGVFERVESRDKDGHMFVKGTGMVIPVI